jgi:hypothetical protein
VLLGVRETTTTTTKKKVGGLEEVEKGGDRANGWIMNASCVHP